MENKSRVYIKIDDENRLIQIEGEYTLSNFPNLEECIKIDEGYGDKFSLAQTHYLAKPIREHRGIPQYKYIDGEVVERTQQEIDDDYVEPPYVPTQTDRNTANIDYVAMMTGVELPTEN